MAKIRGPKKTVGGYSTSSQEQENQA